jgi:predicted peptidase
VKKSKSDLGPGQHRAAFHQTITKSIGYDYVVHLPPDYGERRKRFPLIVFLHGSGECGRSLAKVEKTPVLKYARAHADEFPFIVIAPQSPSDKDWWQVESLDALLDHALASYAIDVDRVYLTGFSMGGYGTWDWACHRPRAFAAIAPIAGQGNDDWAGDLKNVPVWAFHGAKDKAVSPTEEKRMVDAVNRAGGNAKLTLYPDAGHDAWSRTYADPSFFAWLLEQKRPNRR